jgi:hypothetical protein
MRLIMANNGLSNVQKELLKIYANNVSENTLLEIKQILAKYFAEKATSAMDEFWDKNNLTEQTMIDWTNEHDRIQISN